MCAPTPKRLAAPQAALILASASVYRQELLERLRLPFAVCASQVDERPLPLETPAALAARLALAKARAVAAQYAHAVVLGCDQVADLDGAPLGKPGNHARAAAQLRAMRGRVVLFHTALTVACASTGFERSDMAQVRVQFRSAHEGLSDAAIEAYLQAEQPWDCAGSAKSEALGIALLARIDSDDPTALIGLPLIRTCNLLAAAGLPVLAQGA